MMPVCSKLLLTLPSTLLLLFTLSTESIRTPGAIPRAPPNLPTYCLPSRRDCSDLFQNSPSTPSIAIDLQPVQQESHRCSLAASKFERCSTSRCIYSHRVHVFLFREYLNETPTFLITTTLTTISPSLSLSPSIPPFYDRNATFIMI